MLLLFFNSKKMRIAYDLFCCCFRTLLQFINLVLKLWPDPHSTRIGNAATLAWD